MHSIEHSSFNLVVVGAGGTGSNFIRLAGQLLGNPMIQGTLEGQYLLDGDIIEEKNCQRQAFHLSEVNQSKAVQLAMKCNATNQTEFRAVSEYVNDPEEILSLFRQTPEALPVLVGCVDNHTARQVMHKVFEALPDICYMDSSNFEWDGDVICGLKLYGQVLMPPRADIYPDVLEPQPEVIRHAGCDQVAESQPQQLATNITAGLILMYCLMDLLLFRQVKDNFVPFDVTEKRIG